LIVIVETVGIQIQTLTGGILINEIQPVPSIAELVGPTEPEEIQGQIIPITVAETMTEIAATEMTMTEMIGTEMIGTEMIGTEMIGTGMIGTGMGEIVTTTIGIGIVIPITITGTITDLVGITTIATAVCIATVGHSHPVYTRV